MIIDENEQLKRKSRVMTDIRDLNKLITNDSYSLSMQNDIIALLKKCDHINLMNELTFFHQFMIARDDRHKFFFITHREKKQMNVMTMRFKNF